MLEELTQARAVLAGCVDAPAWAVSDAELLDCLDAVHRLQQAVAAVTLHLVRQVDVRELPAAVHATSTAGFLRERLRVNIGTARRLVSLAREVEQRPGLDQALGAGVVNAEQVAAIVDTVTDLPTDVGAEVVDKAQALLVDWAGQFEAQALRRLGCRILEHVAPEVAERVDAAALARDEARAVAARGFTMSPLGDGRVRLSGWLDSEAAAVVSAALDPLCTPRRAGTTHGQGPLPAAGHGLAAGHELPAGHGPPADHGLAAGHGLAGGQGPPGGRGPGMPPDERTAAQRRADALVEVCQLALATGELPVNGGDRPQLTVTVDLDTLRRQVGAGTLDTGARLTAPQLRRLACDAQLLPAVLGGQSQVLDVGQSRRLITGPLRRALVLRDRGCAFPACDRPARWCEGHHIRSWVDGGATSLDNAVLLCGHHHRVIHHQDWTVRLGHDRHPEFLPPPHIDPQRRPRRNQYHRRN